MYDWVPVPLVYTQVSTICVYSYFLLCSMGRQFLDPTRNYTNYNADFYIPFFTIIQFFFYMVSFNRFQLFFITDIKFSFQ